ncbi:hypothetical protein BHU16_09620 [Tannerella sp. oral taxon 808]|nr:hypothetical protein BHU16_09620 [Tannerella sp. oral taxon 808]
MTKTDASEIDISAIHPASAIYIILPSGLDRKFTMFGSIKFCCIIEHVSPHILGGVGAIRPTRIDCIMTEAPIASCVIDGSLDAMPDIDIAFFGIDSM